MSLDFSSITAASTVKPPLTSTTDSSKQTGADTSVGSQDYFLKLLVAQINNQDPLNPLDSAQMTSQLAQLNTVQGINKLSTQLDSLLGDVSASQSLQASSLVGHTVLAPATSLTLADGQAIGGIELPEAADTVTVTIKDASGTVVHTTSLGSQAAGITPFVWDGTTDTGTAAAAGSYGFSVEAKAGGSKVVANALSAGVVSSLTPGSDGGSVYVSGIGNTTVSQLKQIY